MRNVSGLDPTHPGQWLLVERLDQMEKESGVPPRVLIDSHAVPENYGMIHGYSSPDAYTSLFLKRPWDYLHGVAGVVPPLPTKKTPSPRAPRKSPFLLYVLANIAYFAIWIHPIIHENLTFCSTSLLKHSFSFSCKYVISENHSI